MSQLGGFGRTHRARAARATVGADRKTNPTACKALTIVGDGRIGRAFFDMGSGNDVVVKRGETVEGPEGPILVCTRNESLQGVVDCTPEHRRKDLVFLQNGMLQPWLDANGLGSNTQLLVYFAVAKYGDKPVDGITETNPDGLTRVCGEHDLAVAHRIRSGGLTCHTSNWVDYQKAMLEKLVWICAFMLVGSRNGGCTVGEVADAHHEEVSLLILELVRAGEHALEIQLDDGVVARLCAYARSVAHFPTALKEQEWRNGWFVSLSEAAKAEGRADPCPVHSEWLEHTA